MDKVEELLTNYQTFTTQQAESKGISRVTLSSLVNQGKLERLKEGVYIQNDDLVDDYALISYKNKRVVFSHHTALYLHDLSDRVPNVFHISVPQGYNASRLTKKFSNIQVHYIKKENFDLGISIKKSPFGNAIQVYDAERTICDIIANKNKIDKQIYTHAIKTYFEQAQIDKRKLIKYSKKLGVELTLRGLLEVLG